MGVPKRVADRLKENLKGYQKILVAQRDRDISEADTVTVVKDILADVFGFDKYAEVNSEHAIRGTYCDLALAIDSKLSFLIEVKAIGIELKDSHVKQAVDYAANQGCDWVVLTNGIQWILYNVVFGKPIDKREIVTLDLLEIGTRSEADIEKLYLLTREGITKSAMAEYRDRQEAMSRHVLAAILLNCDSVVGAVRKEVRRVSDLLVDEAELTKVLKEQVIKREAIEGEDAEKASRRVKRAADKPLRKPRKKKTPATEDAAASDGKSAAASAPARD